MTTTELSNVTQLLAESVLRKHEPRIMNDLCHCGHVRRLHVDGCYRQCGCDRTYGQLVTFVRRAESSR